MCPRVSKTSGISLDGSRHLLFYQVHAAKHCIKYCQNFDKATEQKQKRHKLTPLQIKAHYCQKIKASKRADCITVFYLFHIHIFFHLTRRGDQQMLKVSPQKKTVPEKSHVFILFCTYIFNLHSYILSCAEVLGQTCISAPKHINSICLFCVITPACPSKSPIKTLH